MKTRHQLSRLRHALLLGAAVALLPSYVSAQSAQNSADDKIIEMNITNNPYLSSGEPEIAIDPRNPRRLAIIEFAMGAGAPPLPNGAPNPAAGAHPYNGRVMLSDDGGNTWVQAGAPPASRPNSRVKGGGDPMIAIGPDGTIYAADEPPPVSTGQAAAATGEPAAATEQPTALAGQAAAARDLSGFDVMIAASTDGGRTFGAAQIAGTPADRPWLAVDQSTGTVYTVSSGALNVKTGVHNIPGPDAPNDRWLIAWKPHLAGKSEPRRLGGPDFAGSGGSTLTAAHGVVAATFVLGGPAPGGGFTGATPPATPVPASLRDVMKNGVTSCSMQAPCLFFETSSDQGAHWTRHHVVVPADFVGRNANVAADPGRPGRYAISLLSADRAKLLVMLTNDSGATWSGPATVPETASGADFKYWMAYGPTGVLGLVWRKERLDVVPPASAPGARAAASGPAYDIYASVSCDGGPTWLPATRVNAETSPPGPPGRDDMSFIALDARYAHLVWGDHRMPVPNTPNHAIQAYYGRVPFSALSPGASCGRK